ncbi:methyl-accepting chemotaxis protein [Motilimonas sp. E26]|uniref:methyl-accepting chemotaxis protein n=1 Tax=Motilimonas sp. E26 TaxID=2865674 RepID=UPI001E52C9D4|nr:methyl-accepting chemotaxis protein [Motilimonas sp. E26]MCE0557278.1 methyl-accepting chemotaxis protein [Motilimonas sp. E26]
MLSSLKAKMVTMVLLVLLATVGVLISVSYFKAATQKLASIENESHNQLSAYAFGIANWLDSKRSAIKGMQLAAERMPPDRVYSHLQQTLLSGDFILTYYGTEQGEMFRNDPKLTSPEGFDPRTRSWYKSAKSTNDVVISKPFVSVTAQKTVVAVATSVKIDGKFYGVVGANLALDKLSQDVAKIPMIGDSQAILVDGSGLIIAYQDHQYNLKQLSDVSNNLTHSLVSELSQTNNVAELEVQGMQSLVLARKVPNTDWYLVSVLDKSPLLAPLTRLLYEQIGMGVITLILVALIVSLVVGRLLKELIDVSNALADIANGEGDLTARINTKSQDEVGRLGVNFNAFVERIHVMVKKLSQVTHALNERAVSTANVSEQTPMRLTHQQDEITQVATAVTEMVSATMQIASNADSAAESANLSVQLSRTGLNQMEKSQHSILALSEEVNTSVAIIGELDQHAKEISSIISTISDIAEQTNLLALNAAIEAARAGEQGRGFAVVADEVRILSQRTHKSTNEIQAMIEALQQSTEQAVSVMKGSYGMSQQSVDDVNLAGESLRNISLSITEISDMATQIATAAEEQAKVTEEISRNTEAAREVSYSLADNAKMRWSKHYRLRSWPALLSFRWEGLKFN